MGQATRTSSLSISSTEDENALDGQNYRSRNQILTSEWAKMDDDIQVQPEQPNESSPILSSQEDSFITTAASKDFGGIPNTLWEGVVATSTPELSLQIEDRRDLRIRTEGAQLLHLTPNPESECEIVATSDATGQQRMVDFESEYNNLGSPSTSTEQDCWDLQSEVNRLRNDEHEMCQLRQSYDDLKGKAEIQSEALKFATLYHEATQNKDAMEAQVNTLQKSLDACKDDLFRLQPVAQTPDTEILEDFESLIQHIRHWIEVEIDIFEKKYLQARNEVLFSADGNDDVARVLQRFPQVGEYLVRSVIHHYLQTHMLGEGVYFLGLPEDFIYILQDVEQSMAQLQPQRDKSTIKAWRSETLKAFAATKEFANVQKKYIQQFNAQLHKFVGQVFPVIKKQKGATQRLREEVSIPAANLALKLQASTLTYRFTPQLPQNPLQNRSTPFKARDVETYTLIDIKTGKTLKADGEMLVGSGGFLGKIMMPVEPSLNRCDGDGTAVELRKAVYLVEPGQATRKRKRKSS